MSVTALQRQKQIEAELLGAAVHYVTVADWFESHPCRWHKQMSESEAMDLFNQAETQLRRAGAKALRAHGHRELILKDLGIPRDAR